MNEQILSEDFDHLDDPDPVPVDPLAKTLALMEKLNAEADANADRGRSAWWRLVNEEPF
jgi:hypothetical protein